MLDNTILFCSCNNEMTIDYSSTLLLKHNQLRSQLALGLSQYDLPIATNMEYLLWEDELANVAYIHASTCAELESTTIRSNNDSVLSNINIQSLTFNATFDNYYFGNNINIFDYSSADYPDFNDSFLINYELMVQEWFSSLSNYTYGDDFDNTMYSGWRGSTRYIGCSSFDCTLFTRADGTPEKYSIYTVCYYFPNEWVFHPSADLYKSNKHINGNSNTNTNTNQVCTHCAIDRNDDCINGLCWSCPSMNYFTCQEESICNVLPCDFQDARSSCPNKCQSRCNNITSAPTSSCQIQILFPNASNSSSTALRLPTTSLPTTVTSQTLTDSSTVNPSTNPTNIPTNNPTNNPTDIPTYDPTDNPTNNPTHIETDIPIDDPKDIPTDIPSIFSTSKVPSNSCFFCCNRCQLVSWVLSVSWVMFVVS